MRGRICQSLTFCGVIAILERLHFLTRSVFILSTRSSFPLVGVCTEREGCCELPGNSQFPPVGRKPAQFPSGPFVFSQQPAVPGLGQLGGLSGGETEPSRVSELAYELMVCAEHGWEGTLHESLKQFSAKELPAQPGIPYSEVKEQPGVGCCHLLTCSSGR